VAAEDLDAPPTALDGEAEELGCCPPLVLEWATRTRLRYFKRNRPLDRSVWPTIFKQLPQPTLHNDPVDGIDRFYQPERFAFWVPEIFWPR
jgi:hypothetical protein